MKNLIHNILKEEFNLRNRFTLSDYDEDFSKYCFENILNYNMNNYDSTITDYVDKNISKTIVDTKTGQYVGIYVIGNISLPDFKTSINDDYTPDVVDVKIYNIQDFYNKKGVYGIMLAVLPQYRNMGVGKLLINYGQSLSNYIWGIHDNNLNNLNHWIKRRNVVGELFIHGQHKGYITAT